MFVLGLVLLIASDLTEWESHFSGGKWEPSLEAAEMTLASDSSSAEAWAALSFSMSVMSMQDEALTSAERALAEDSSSALAWGALGRATLSFDTDAAFEAFTISLGLDPSMPLSTVGLAHILVMDGSYNEASDLLDQAFLIDPSWLSLWLEKIQVLQYLDEFGAAREMASEALERWPDSYQVLLEYGWIMEMLGKPDSAEETYRRVAELYTEDTEALISLGLMYESMWSYGEAVKTYREALDRNPGYSWLLGEMGLCFESAGNPDAAAGSYFEAWELDPGYAFAAYRLGYLAEEESDTESALEWYSACTAADPSFVDAWISIGLLNEDIGDLEAAETAYRSALEQDPGESWTWGELGAVLEQLGRYEEAGEAYETGVALFPDYIWAWEQRGILLENMDQLEEAAAWYLLATERTDPGPWLLGELGFVLEQLELVDSAMVYYREAIAVDSTYLFGMMRLAPLESSEGRTSVALGIWDDYLAAGGDQSTAMTEQVLLLESLGRMEEADSLTEFIAAEHLSAWVDMAYRYAVTDPDHALEICARAEADGMGGDGFLWSDLAVLYGSLEEHELAQSSFTRATELSPEETGIWYEWGYYLFNEDLDEEAADKYRIMVGLDSLSFDAWSSLGEATLFSEQYDEASFALERALELDTRSQWVLAYIGLVYEQTGYPDKALDYYFRSLSVSPGYDYTETRIREITDTGFDPEWNRRQTRRFNASLFVDTRAENGNVRERQYSVGAEISYDYDGRGSLVSLEADYALRETNEAHLNDFTWASTRISLERVLSGQFSAEVSSYWDRQPGTVRPWQISSYMSLGYDSWVTDWLWVSPTLGIGLVNTHWSSGLESRRTDRTTMYGSVALWLEFEETLWPALWLWGDFYQQPDNAEELITNGLAELTFDVWDPLSLTLGYSVAYTRRPLFSYWEKYDTELYSRLNVRIF